MTETGYDAKLYFVKKRHVEIFLRAGWIDRGQMVGYHGNFAHLMEWTAPGDPVLPMSEDISH